MRGGEKDLNERPSDNNGVGNEDPSDDGDAWQSRCRPEGCASVPAREEEEEEDVEDQQQRCQDVPQGCPRWWCWC